MKTLIPPGIEYVVRIGRHAVHFHLNIHSQRVYSVVADDEATKFTTEQTARDMAKLFEVTPGKYTVESISMEAHI